MGTSRSMVLRFDGDKELEAAFNALALGAQKKIFRPALRAGGKVILAAVKARVPKGTGALGRSIKLRASRRSLQRIGVAVFVDNKLIPLGKGEQQHNREGFYPAHLELGYVRGGIRLRTRATGSKTVVGGTVIPPRSFIRAGFDAVKEQAMAAIEAEVARRMEAIWQRPSTAASPDEAEG